MASNMTGGRAAAATWLVFAVYVGTCIAITWWAIGWVAGVAGIHLKLLGAVLALVAVVELGCGFQMLLIGLLVGLLVLVFTDTADPFAMAKVGGIGLTVGIAFRIGWIVVATAVSAFTQRLGRGGS